MQKLFFQFLSFLPGICSTIVIAYFYFKKKIPGLLWLLAAEICLTMFQFSSTFFLGYLQEMSLTIAEMQRAYVFLGVMALMLQILVAVALGVVLSRYPAKKE